MKSSPASLAFVNELLTQDTSRHFSQDLEDGRFWAGDGLKKRGVVSVDGKFCRVS
jgi:hypothetical protein